MEQLSPDKAQARLAAWCSRGERAESDLRGKLSRWCVAPADAERIIRRLREEGFLDDGRYARAFVHDKFHFNGWGRLKIALALRQKGIDAALARAALDEIDPQRYRATLLRLLHGKRRALPERDSLSARAALLRFGASRGFEAELCYSCVDELQRDASGWSDD